MARNKKNESALRPGPLLATVAACAMFVLLGVGYVWYKNQIDVLGHQIKERENRLADLRRENQVRRDQLAMLCSPVALDSLVKKLKLGLGPPAKSQVIWMTETPGTSEPDALAAGARQAQALLAEGRN